MTVAPQVRTSSQTSWAHFKKRLRRSLPWYPFILVNIIVFLVFNFIPWIRMMETSLYKTDLLTGKEFVGLGHFFRMFEDQHLHRAVLNTIAFMIMFVPAFVVHAAREEQAKVAQDTRLSPSTRKYLLAELKKLELAFYKPA